MIGQDDTSLISDKGAGLRSPAGGNVIQVADRSYMMPPAGFAASRIIAGGTGNLLPAGR